MTKNYSQKSQSKDSLFPRWFTIWFLASCGIYLLGGIADQVSGKTSDVNAWGASIGIFLMYLVVLLVWSKRNDFQTIISKLPVAPLVAAVFVGWSFAEIDELVCFPFNPLFPEATLVQDIVLTTPMYVFAHLFWFWVLRKYRFTVREAFYLGGTSLGIIELVSGGAGGMVLLGITWPFMVMIHGCHMLMPRIALNSFFTALEQKETRWKYPIGILAPIIGTVIGIGISSLIGSLLFELK